MDLQFGRYLHFKPSVFNKSFQKSSLAGILFQRPGEISTSQQIFDLQQRLVIRKNYFQFQEQ